MIKKAYIAFGLLLIASNLLPIQGYSETRDQAEKTDMVILVDRSGSMNDPGGDPQGLSRAAVEFLIDQLELANDGNRVSVVLFNSRTSIIPKAGLSSDFHNVRSALDPISRIGGNTDLEEALNIGLQMLAKSPAQKEIVLISDGKPEPDFSSARIASRFPDEVQRYQKVGAKVEKKKLLQKLSDLSTERIEKLFFGILRENDIQVYPVALTGIQANGEALLQKMAAEVTQDKNSFIKVQARGLITGLDQIVPKPISLMNIHRASLNSAGDNQWSVNFTLNRNLQKVRLLTLYRKKPDGNIKWIMKGPMGMISADTPGNARYIRAKDKNGKGVVIFERIFLDQPMSGNYSLRFTASKFLPPMQVIIEGRTNLRLSVASEPKPSEVALPVRFFCRLEGGSSGQLHGVRGDILDETGNYAAHNLSFDMESGQALSASWVPTVPGRYQMHVTGYLDKQKKQYLKSKYGFQIIPKQAVILHVEIPVRK